MAKRRKPVTTYKASEVPAYLLIRETIEDGRGGQAQRRTAFLGIIYDKGEAEKVVAALNRKKSS